MFLFVLEPRKEFLLVFSLNSRPDVPRPRPQPPRPRPTLSRPRPRPSTQNFVLKYKFEQGPRPSTTTLTNS